MPPAYTEDQQAPRTFTQPLACVGPSPLPLPEGEVVEQPAKASGPPSPWPFSQWEKGGRQAGLRVRSLLVVSRSRAGLERLNPALLSETITAAADELTRDRQCCDLRFRRQHQFGDHLLDFYCHEAKLAVELDGEPHIPPRWLHFHIVTPVPGPNN